MFKTEFVGRIDRKCLFCHRSDLYEDGKNELSEILEGNLIKTCQTHFPEDLSELVDWDPPSADGPVFCFRCFDNVVKLSKLNEKLTDIQRKIKCLGRQMYVYVFCERERQNSIIWKNKPIESSTVKAAEGPQNPPLVTLPQPVTISNDFPQMGVLANHEDEMETTEVFTPAEIRSQIVSTEKSLNAKIEIDVKTCSTKIVKFDSKKRLVVDLSQKSKGSEKRSQYECDRCNKKFVCLGTLRKHDCKKKTNESESFGESFTAEYLDQDKLLDEGKIGEGSYKHSQDHGNDSFKCLACGQGHTSLKGLQKHFRLVHEKFKCRSCGIFCDDNSDLKAHLQTHRNSFTKANITSKTK